MTDQSTPAYIVFTRLAITDQAEFDRYNEKVGASFKGHAATPLVAYGPHEELEGEENDGVVILAFPSRAAAKAWYDSPAYRDAREHRFAGARYQVTLVDGLPRRAG